MFVFLQNELRTTLGEKDAVMSLPGKLLGVMILFSTHSCRPPAKKTFSFKTHEKLTKKLFSYFLTRSECRSHRLAAAPQRPRTAPPSGQLCPAC